MELVIFIPAAATALAGAVALIMARQAVHGALALLVVLASLAVMYLLLWAQFIAVLQVIIYAGAIVVVFLFVIMLLHMRTGETATDPLRRQRPAVLVVVGLFLAALVVSTIGGRSRPPVAPAPEFGTAEAVGRALFTRFLLPFELASLILLIGIIAAVVLSKAPAGSHGVEPR